jgi:predicted DNA-binding transcriptional regulator AlpA
MVALTPRDRAELAAEIAEQVYQRLNAKEGKPALVDANELAKALSVSQSTVDRWTAQGLVPVKIRLGSVRRYAIDEVIDALAKVKDLA